MRLALRLVWIAAWLGFAALAPLQAAPNFPPLTGRVVDQANILSDDTRERLTSMLAQQEQQTHVQVVVVTLTSLQGYPIEDYGYRLGRAWGIGQKGKNNGTLLIVAPNDHKVRIEVGYGLEGQLTDAQTKVIIDRIITPAFKHGDYDAGVLDGTTAILQTIGGARITAGHDSDDTDDAHDPGGGRIPLLLIVLLVWIVFGRFLWPLFFLGGLGGGRGGWGGGGWGGGSGGGGFSGGGGSFGGGGASGSW